MLQSNLAFHFLGFKPFVFKLIMRSYTLQRSSLISRRYCSLAFVFSRYNLEVKHKPREQHALTDAFSRRPHYELDHITTLSSSITDLIRTAYAKMINASLYYVPLIVKRIKIRALSCRHGYVRAYIDIPSIKCCCTIV